MSTFKVNIPAGPIWDQKDVEDKSAPSSGSTPGVMDGTVEHCRPRRDECCVEVELQVKNTGSDCFKTNVLAGPLWSNDEAQKVGETLAASYGGTFTGEWHTIVEGKMSVIEVEFKF